MYREGIGSSKMYNSGGSCSQGRVLGLCAQDWGSEERAAGHGKGRACGPWGGPSNAHSWPALLLVAMPNAHKTCSFCTALSPERSRSPAARRRQRRAAAHRIFLLRV